MRRLLAVVWVLGVVGCGPIVQDGPMRADALVGPWQPVPFGLPVDVISNVDLACRTSMPDFPAAVEMVVFDARGGGRVEAHYVGDDGANATCFGMPIDVFGHVKAGGGATGFPDVPPPPLGPLAIASEGGYSSEESSVAVGRAGPAIAKVVIVRPGEADITASLSNGWFLAWWPDTWGPEPKAVGFDARGQSVIEVELT
jgi:hypothetical protein